MPKSLLALPLSSGFAECNLMTAAAAAELFYILLLKKPLPPF
jgi:hypothetical protein